MRLRWLAWFFSLVLALAAGSMLGVPGIPADDEASEPLVTIDLKVFRDSLGRCAAVGYQPAILGEIVTNRLLMKLTSDKGVTFDSKELKWPKYLRKDEDYNAFGPHLWPVHALNKLLERDWPPTRLRAFHRLFQRELSQYEIRGLEILRSEDLASFKFELSSGADFEVLLAHYSMDLDGLFHEVRGAYSSTELEEQFGADAAASICQLKAGEYTPLLHRGSSSFIFQLVKSRTTYEQLKPELHRRLLETRRLALIYQLFQTPDQPLTVESRVEYDWEHWR
ncbi:hypothetical protein JST97_21685 [bacterium]|nr:hypothetical protein [bacterium]